MITKQLKKRCLTLGIIFTVAGIILTTVGFGLSGFDYRAYKTNEENNDIFRTIHWDSND